ncbi:MAG: ABC-2 type transport system permease protein [Polaribacter sp.]|jgi:ABC-2 type transport system permease protein
MFKQFFLFELKYRLQRPMIYIFFLINFLLVFAATVSDNVSIGGGNDAIHLNSPHVIMSMTLLMTLIGIFMTTAFMNTAILRDFNYKFDGILFSAPIRKFGYLGGRFFGAFLMALIPLLGVFAGIALGAASPWVEANEVGAFSIMPYVNTFFVGVLPNTLLISSIVFLLGALFRSSLVSFIGAISILVGYIIMLSFSTDLDSEMMSILSDPLAISSHSIITKYWTVDDKNTQLLALSGPLLWNRLIWITFSLICLAVTYFRFSFTAKRSFFKRKNKKITTVKNNGPVFSKLKPLPKVSIHDNFGTTWKQFIHQTKMEFWGIAKSTPFIVLLAIGIINMLASVTHVDEMFGTGNHPVTYLMVDGIRGSLYLFLMAILMYYAGDLIWRERDAKMNELFDASPFPTWIPFASKLFGLIGMLYVILSVAIVCGVGVQAISGYTNFELGIYIKEFLIYDALSFSMYIILAMLIQTLVNNKYIAYFIFILAVICLNYLPTFLEWESNLVFFGATPYYVYSDMNGWSAFAKGINWFNGYWVLFSGLLGMFSILFWVRGKSLTFKQRLNIARQRFTGKIAFGTIALLLLWVGTGSFLFYQTKVINKIVAEETQEKAAAKYEKEYKKYQHIAQPRITAIDYSIDIYPAERNFSVKANLTVKNKTKEAIDKIHFSMPDGFDANIEIAGATLEMEDKESQYRIYNLAKPMQAGETASYKVSLDYITKGIENEVSNTDIVKSGTFLSNFKMIPTIGYSTDGELSDKKIRAEYDLPFRPRMEKLHVNCGHSCQNTYISSDADWVNVSSTISTAIDQTAIAPGTLMKEWSEDNRKFFRYELKKPVLNFYSFISGIYEIKKEVWTDPNGKKVDLEVYYHKGHEYNVDKMLESLRQSLDYCSKNFTPYPHGQARIIEFPRYSSFAQAFPGTMPYSESIGFIANLKEEDAIDMVYYVVAHEMAHQWWAHQVIGAPVQGATMLSETFAQYSALMIMQKKYGKDKMKQFLKYEMDRYLRGRGRENEKELPLMLNENQQYIHYRKGSVVMYALQDFIGEDSLNLALRRYAEAVAYQEAPYTNTLEVMNYISEVTPDSLQYLLTDMFKEITLYSNKTNTATFKKLSDNKYEVKIEVSIEKYRADSLGKETLIPHNDFIDVGVFSKEKNEGEKYGRPIVVERHRISSRDTSFTFVVDELPYEAGIDPNYLLVDRFPVDNVKKLVWEE